MSMDGTLDRGRVGAALAVVLAVVASMLVVTATPALASHYISSQASATISEGDDGPILTVRVESTFDSSSSFGSPTFEDPNGVSISNDPSGAPRTDSVSPGLEAVEVYEYDLSGLVGNADFDEGIYTISDSSNARITGYNHGQTPFSYELGFRFDPNDPYAHAGTPVFTSSIITNVATSDDFSQNLGAEDPDGAAVIYELVESDHPIPNGVDVLDQDVGGQTLDLVELADDGTVTIPATTSQAVVDDDVWSPAGRANVSMKVLVTNEDTGAYATRDIGFLFGETDNVAPQFSGLQNGDVIEAPVGETTEFELVAVDDEGTISIDVTNLPPWAELGDPTTSDGRTVRILTLSPGSGDAGDARRVNIEATDDDDFSLTRSISVTLQVSGSDEPEPVPDEDGELPSPRPGDHLTMLGIDESNDDVTVDAGSGSWTISGDGFSIRVARTQGGDEPSESGVGEVLRLLQGGDVTVTVDGFAPHWVVRLWLFSEPELLGEFVTDNEGALDLGLAVLPEDIEPCGHTLQAEGRLADGRNVATSMGIWVVADPFPFSDVNQAGFHAPGIGCLEYHGIVAGVGDGEFDEDSTVSRGQAASMAANALGADTTGSSSFADSQGSVHDGAIGVLDDLGIVSGRDDNTFDPAGDVTRGQAASILAASARLDTSGPSDFTDVAGSVHEGAIAALVETGAVNGFADGTFRPGEVVSRGQFSSMLASILDQLQEDEDA